MFWLESIMLVVFALAGLGLITFSIVRLRRDDALACTMGCIVGCIIAYVSISIIVINMQALHAS